MGAFQGFCFGHIGFMGADEFNKVCSDFLDGIQGSHGVLKDKPDVLSSDGPHFLVGQMHNICSVNSYVTVYNYAWNRYKLNY